ncbi:TetR/AcrR family transcriptional regulator [Streptomyces sp. ISL-66]|uniref:TetR/AcrR family transcriptional regulator n=1 Tax=Streptomyces sp. ISL-66 TaxID=2819186 RepID=UPI001BE64276|nr:TetR/AcrR family transcriptional regulator [Streptomyces sp. ISL-66]MBT2469064.1 TetR/AcrR family transcriptional regulator [Streptomyces sp. ISL-66]
MQERAARTRRTLVSAAACEFDRCGYTGASLVRISRAAGISMGALTFHFPNKEELAEVVRAQGHEITVAVVERLRVREEAPVPSVVALTLALAGLLEQEACVRAAARLTRERPGCGPDWTSAWVPTVHERLRRLGAQGDGFRAAGGREFQVDPGADRWALAALATHLIAGVEADVRRRAGGEEEPDGRTAAQLARIWDLVLSGQADATSDTGTAADAGTAADPTADRTPDADTDGRDRPSGSSAP